MNFFDNIPNFNGPFQGMNNPQGYNPMVNNEINYKINELENRIKRLEQRISLLESNNSTTNYTEPDKSLYMI